MYENEMYPILWDDERKRVGLVFRNWIYCVNDLNLVEFHVNGQPDQIIDAYLRKIKGDKNASIPFISKEEIEEHEEFIENAKKVLGIYLSKQYGKEKYVELFDQDLSITHHSIARWALNQAAKKGLLPNKYLVVEKYGDCLETKCDIVLHQVNLQGIMGGGIALSIARKYKNCEKEYQEYEPKKLGEVCFCKTDDFVIGNCFSQNEEFETSYEALRICLRKVKEYMEENELYSVSIPYKYGCGIAKGDWEKVKEVFLEELNTVQLVIYRL